MSATDTSERSDDGPTAPRQAARGWLRTFKTLLGLALLAGILVWNDNGIKLLEVLRGLRPEYLLAVLVVSMATNLISSAKWGLFLRERGHHLGWWRLLSLYLIGRFFNNFLPSMFGGDVARAYILGREISSQSVSAASVVLERASGLVGLALLAVVGAIISPGMLENPLIAIPLAAAILANLLGVAAFLRPEVSAAIVRGAERLPLLRKVARKIEKLLNDIGHYRRKHRLLLLSLVYSFGFHLVASLNVYVACLAIDFQPSFLQVMVVTPVILLLSMIPVSPNNIGWWEWCFGVLLIGAGATASEGVAVAIVLRAVTFLVSLFGGLLLLVRRSAGPDS
jgi:uncharacterized protein (TIRG00374 family)